MTARSSAAVLHARTFRIRSLQQRQRSARSAMLSRREIRAWREIVVPSRLATTLCAATRGSHPPAPRKPHSRTRRTTRRTTHPHPPTHPPTQRPSPQLSPPPAAASRPEKMPLWLVAARPLPPSPLTHAPPCYRTLRKQTQREWCAYASLMRVVILGPRRPPPPRARPRRVRPSPPSPAVILYGRHPVIEHSHSNSADSRRDKARRHRRDQDSSAVSRLTSVPYIILCRS